MVLLVLAIVWAVLLVSWLRSRTDGTLLGLGWHVPPPPDRAGASRARHRDAGQPAAQRPGRRPWPAALPPAGPVRGPAARLPGPAADRCSDSAAPARPPVAPAVRRRRQAQKRRRDVFFALLAGVVGTFLVALIPGLSVMWAVQVSFDVVFVGYVALLVRMRNLAAERELKLTFMPQPARAARARPAYDLGRDYGELSLRRAAN